MKTLTFLFSFFVAMTASNLCWARDWVVDRVSGAAYVVTRARERIDIKPQMTVAEGLTIMTSPNGRVRLVSENNVMTLLPNTTAAVVPKSFFSSKTEVLQRTGSIEFDIEKRKQPHFTVQTPYMAAVVKGTKFTVSVAKSKTKIGVARGLVQVSDLRTGQSAAVGAGQNASVASSTGGLRTGGVDAPAVTQGTPSTPSVAPAGISLSEFRSETAATQADASQASAATSASSAASSSNSSSASSQSGGGASSSFGNGSGGGGGGGNANNASGNSAGGGGTSSAGEGSSTGGNSETASSGGNTGSSVGDGISATSSDSGNAGGNTASSSGNSNSATGNGSSKNGNGGGGGNSGNGNGNAFGNAFGNGLGNAFGNGKNAGVDSSGDRVGGLANGIGGLANGIGGLANALGNRSGH